MRFTIDDDLGNINRFKLVFADNVYEKKQNFWMKKDNIGIIAKMSTNKKIGLKLGLRRNINFKSTDELWKKILNKKFAIDAYKNILINTNNYYLLEFDKGAKNKFDKHNMTLFWSGLIKDNILYGNNQMGKYLMDIRNNITEITK